MAWYDSFPGAGGGGGDWLSGLSDPYGSYAPDGLSGQLPNWYDRFPGAGLSPAAGPDLGGGMTPSYGLAGLYSGGVNPLTALLFNLPTYSPQAAAGSAFTSPWAGGALPLGTSGFGQQGFGGFGSGGLPSLGFNQQGIGGQRTLQSPQMGRGVGGGGQQGLGGMPSQMPGYGQPQQGYAPQQTGYSGGTSNPANVGGAGGGGFAAPLDPGGIYGQQKWVGGNGIDVFTRRGSPIYAMFDGQAQVTTAGMSPMGPVPAVLLRGNNGMSAQYTHVQGNANGPVRKGQVIGYVNDPSMDMLGPYQGMPDGFQHLDLTVGHGGGPFSLQGGDINAAQFLQSIGYQGQQIGGVTRGPQGGPGGGMGMGGPMGMFGGGGGMGMGGFPGMPGMSPFGGGGGMSPFGGGGMPGMSPFGGGGGMNLFGGGGGMGGFGGMPGGFGGF